MTIPKEFLVERQGKTFCLYAGLLAMAHEQGLTSILTELVQVPNEANNRTAICTATITLVKGDDSRTFQGIGDAAPNNVAPAMQTCLIRMAETRAKARAMRDAVNVGMAAMEELGDNDSYEGSPERGYQTAPRTSAPRRQPTVRTTPPNALVHTERPARPTEIAQTTAAPISENPTAKRWIDGINKKYWKPQHLQSQIGRVVSPQHFGELSAEEIERLNIFMEEAESAVTA